MNTWPGDSQLGADHFNTRH